MKEKLLLLALLVPGILDKTYAQDAHYWESGFTPGGVLMPGAVIANNRDSGVFFYNPALLAIHPKSSVSVSANIYELERIKITDGVGQGKPLKSSRPRIIPQMVSGTIAFKKKLALGYALIHNPIISYASNQRQDKRMDILDNSYSPGDEEYIGQYTAHNRINQIIAVISAGLKVSERLAIGVSIEGHQRSQDYFEDYKSRAIVNSDTALFKPLSSVTSFYEATYSHIGVRFKGGLSYDAGRHHFGLLVSSPLVKIRGSATVQSDLEIHNLQLSDGITLNQMANGRQTKLPAAYKLPLSIAAAYAVDFNRGQVYLCAEYFSKISNYNIIMPRNESFIRPDTGNAGASTSALLRMHETRRDVTNFALGVSYYVNPRFTAIGSFRTDFSYAIPPAGEFTGYQPQVVSWNNWHAQLGGNFRRRRFNLRAGLLLTYGRTSQYEQPVNFDTPTEQNLLVGNQLKVKANYFSAGLLLSYVHNL